jgi:hypothetical protein
MAATKIVFVVRAEAGADADQLEDTLLNCDYEFQSFPSQPVELYPGANGQVIWNNAEIVVRYTLEHKRIRDHLKGGGQMKDVAQHHIHVHQVVNGREQLPRGYMLGSGALTFEVNRDE